MRSETLTAAFRVVGEQIGSKPLIQPMADSHKAGATIPCAAYISSCERGSRPVYVLKHWLSRGEEDERFVIEPNQTYSFLVSEVQDEEYDVHYLVTIDTNENGVPWFVSKERTESPNAIFGLTPLLPTT